MELLWVILIYLIILGGVLYTVHTLSYGYLPLEETVESIQLWLKHRREKK